MKNNDQMARKIYEDIGTYLGYALPYYAEFYEIKHLLLLGRVTSGEGGSIIVERAKQVLKEEFPHLSNINITMPDESNKRVGQSIAAASLAQSIKKNGAKYIETKKYQVLENVHIDYQNLLFPTYTRINEK